MHRLQVFFLICLLALAGCYEPPDLPMPVAIEYTGPIVIDLGSLFDIPDPNNPYYIPEWDNPFHPIRMNPMYQYRHYRQFVKSE